MKKNKPCSWSDGLRLTLLHAITFFVLLLCMLQVHAQSAHRKTEDFDKGWLFYYADTTDASNDYKETGYDDAKWRKLNLPHDWSVEGEFKKEYPASPGGGALPGGIGWYRKTFVIPASSKGKQVSIDFDGVYRCSEVWINGHYLGFRPNGYISFRYDLTPYLNDEGKNIIVVKVDNSKQPNSRWYSGSGIYRNVWLVTTDKIAVDHWGTYIVTPEIDKQSATVVIHSTVKNYGVAPAPAVLHTLIYTADGKQVGRTSSPLIWKDSSSKLLQQVLVPNPVLWTLDKPYLYKAVSQVMVGGKIYDEYETAFGIRYFNFDAEKGFSLNGKKVKILGVCDHHDLGSLGAAINTRALERQLEILKNMGCNAIRTSHNPPAPELLNLCDEMGFIVMDEAFDMWKRRKTVYDYHLYWDAWHKKDLEDQILRDRNHPSVFMWSIGNEIGEQGDSSGTIIARELAGIVRGLDDTRPITDANNDPRPSHNYILKSGAVDLVGYNYRHATWKNFNDSFPGKKFIGTETTSALETRGEYFMPSDSIRRWPMRRMVNGKRVTEKMNDDFTVSAYDNTSAPWGSTHEESWKEMKKYDFLSGMFIWTGFDYLGEPTPYSWPARSSYFGIIDLAGFPKDAYYMYQGEWTNKTLLHILPHWNWNAGDTVDVWAYYSNADEVELFLNGKSMGIKKKQGEDLHVMWRLKYEPGTLKAVSRRNGQTVLTKEIKTAGKPAKMELVADRNIIKAGGKDLSFITVKILDAAGNLVPKADNRVEFSVNGDAFIASVDNGNPISHEPFKASYRKAFNGLCLAIIQSKEKKGKVTVTARSEGLQTSSVTLELR